MTAAVKTATLVGSVGSEIKTTGTALKSGIYTATVATASDWVVLSDYTVVSFAIATTDADGVANACTIDGTTTNKVVLTGTTTGATTLLVFGY